MTYNKEAQLKYKNNNPELYYTGRNNATNNYRQKNIEKVREKDRIRKTIFMAEWRILRNINIF